MSKKSTDLRSLDEHQKVDMVQEIAQKSLTTFCSQLRPQYIISVKLSHT